MNLPASVTLIATLTLASTGPRTWSIIRFSHHHSAETIKQSQIAGPYRLTLSIGPPLKIVIGSTANSGEVMLGGFPPTCAANSIGVARKIKKCNRGVRLFVYIRRTGHALTGARVTIAMVNRQRHLTVAVPIMMMESPHKGMRDVRYGNNVFAPPGNYTAFIHVNGVFARFYAHLR